MDPFEVVPVRDQPIELDLPLREARNLRTSAHASQLKIGGGTDFTDDEDYPAIRQAIDGSAVSRAPADHGRRKVIFGDEDQAPFSSPYDSSRIAEPRIYRPRNPPQLDPPRSAILPLSDPYQTLAAPPTNPSYSAEPREQRIPPHKEPFPGLPSHDDYTEPQYPRHPRSFERRRIPSRYASPKQGRHQMRFFDPPAPEPDFHRSHKFDDTYNPDPYLSEYRPGELQRRDPSSLSDIHGPLTRNVRRDRNDDNHSQHSLNQLISASSHRPSDLHPSRVIPPSSRPYYLEHGVSAYNSSGDEQVLDSSPSDDDNDDAWVDSRDVDSQESSQSNPLPDTTDASPPIRLYSNVTADEDLVDPFRWHRKLAVTENFIRERHNNRKNWPDAWRHSDAKTCPKSLRDAWDQVNEVDRHVSQLGLDAAFPTIVDSKYQSKQKGSLSEIVTAFKASSGRKAQSTMHTLPILSSDVGGQESWNKTCKQVQRLLKARDYLIAVCGDAEYLNGFHSTMDAITWFEQAQSVNDRGSRTARNEVIELMSLKIPNLSEIVKTLNLILQALMWGWSDQGTICIHSDQQTAITEEQYANDISKERQLEYTESKTIASETYDNGERRIQTCLQTLEIGLKALIVEVEVFAAILNQALFYQCNAHISNGDHPREIVGYGGREVPGLSFTPRGLKCLGELIQDRDVWVLEQFPNEWGKYLYVSPPLLEIHKRALRPLRSLSYIRTTIVDLARIWGPIWKASELIEADSWLWYKLPRGYVGAPKSSSIWPTAEEDEAPSHFSTTVDGNFSKFTSSQFYVPNLPYLLIGHGLPSGLVPRKSCQMTLETGLEGLALQSVGTLKPYKYKDSSSFNVAVGHGGAQVSWNTQIKTNPGILMKQSLLDRWKLEPRFRNPRLLLLWYGVEVSVCTRNARRCRLVDLIRSRSMIRYLSAIYRPEVGSKIYQNLLFAALESSDPNAFVELYDQHPEWQGELGTVVARCLEVLKESGINKKGDLAAFTFIEKYHEPEQLAILPKKIYTWASLLKDSYDSATFALMSHQCLGYPNTPGQKCRFQRGAGQTSKSVLQTSYTSTMRSDMSRIFRSGKMQVSQNLTMRDSSRFKIKRRSSKGIILGTWHRGYLQILRSSNERFREKIEDAEKAIRVFVVSRRKSRLIRLRDPYVVPSKSEDDAASSHAFSSEDVPKEPFSLPHKNAKSSSPPQSLNIPRLSFSSEKVAQSLTTDDASTLRGDGAELVDVSSQIDSSLTKSQKLAAEEPLSLRGSNDSRVHKATQTDSETVNQTHLATPIKEDEFLLSKPANGKSSATLLPHTRGSETDAGSDFTHRSHRNSSRRHGDNNDGSSRRRRRHRRSHSDSPVVESFSRVNKQEH